MTQGTKKILVIDDHVLFADGLGLILGGLGPNIDVTIRNDAQDALVDKPWLRSFDLVLIDLHMPQFSGFGFLTAVQTQGLDVNVAVISGSEKQVEIERAIRLGTQGFIPKDSDSEELLSAVAQLLEGKRYLPLQWAGKIDWVSNSDASVSAVDVLTKRQFQVLELMRDGLQNKQIGVALGISTSSVKGHVEHLFKNFHVNNRTSCVQAARDQGLV